jgi:hypothetical protein
MMAQMGQLFLNSKVMSVLCDFETALVGRSTVPRCFQRQSPFDALASGEPPMRLS